MNKNPASVCFLKLKNITYNFYMKENGSKEMKVYVGTMNLYDYRMNSKLKLNKRVLYPIKHLYFVDDEFEEYKFEDADSD